MSALLDVILPVFLVVGCGYVAAWRKFLSAEVIDGLVSFTQNFAIPCLLFLAIARLDLSQAFSIPLLGTFYFGATLGFFAGCFGARFLFGRPWEDSVAIGFATLFSNSVLMGLSVTESAYGPEALGPNYIIVAFHAPYCYTFGFIAMELVRARGAGWGGAARSITKAIFKNALMIGIALGFAVNLSGLPLPGFLWDGVELMSGAALPTAIFALGGVLYRYRPEGDLMTIAFVCAVSLLVHPLIVWGIGNTVELSPDQMRSAVLTAAMAPGVNAYIFANMYGVARRVVASSVLIGTALTVLSATVWLSYLP